MKAGKNVVLKRLQLRAKIATQQSQPRTEEIAAQSMEHACIADHECGKQFRPHPAIDGHVEAITWPLPDERTRE